MKLISYTLISLSLITGFTSCSKNPVIVDKNARFTVITPNCIRMEYSDNSKFIDNPSLFAFNRKATTKDYKFRKEDSNVIIETKALKLVYKPDGKPFSENNLQIFVKKRDSLVRWVPGMKNRENLGGTLRTVDGISGKTNLGEGIISRDGWYMHDDSDRPLIKNNWVEERPSDAGSDWYFFAYGTDFKSALKSLTAIGGKIPLPRKYVFGSWYSRYWPYTTEDYKQIVEEYSEYGFPLDVIVMDMDWHKDGWTGWSWNRKLLSDPDELLQWFHNQKLAVTMNLHPADGVLPHEDKYKEFNRSLGVKVKEKPDSIIPFDPSNKKYMNSLYSVILNPLRKQGVDFWWLDWQQYEFTKGMPKVKNLEWLNRCFYENSKDNGMRGQSFSRWGGWGDHRYPIHFSGDAVAVWPMLAFEVPFTSTAGNIGCFFWSHDIGGHMGNFDQETNTRWVQFGAVTAALRLHSTRDINMDKRPWKFKPEYLQSMKIAFQFRSELFPYIYTSARNATTESVPLTCPMYIEYPETEIAYHVPQQYLFGKAILAAPITSPGTGVKKVAFQNVWFPEGNWYNMFTNEKYESSEKLQTVWADIDEFPVFAKGGIPIPMQPFRQRMASAPIDVLVVRIYPGADGMSQSSSLYEDDGLSREYENGKYALTDISYKRQGNTYTVIVNKVEGTFKDQLKKRGYLLEFPCTKKAEYATFNGKKVNAIYDEEKLMNIIAIDAVSLEKKIMVSITAEEIDYKLNAEKNSSRRKAELVENLKNKSDFEIINEFVKKNNSNDFINVLSFLNGIGIHVDEYQLSTSKNDVHKDVPVTVKVYDTNGEQTKEVASAAFNKESVACNTFDIDMKPLGFGMKTTRFLDINATINDKKLEYKTVLKEILPAINSWKVLGPFDFDSSKNISSYVYPPENSIDTNKTYQGKNQKEIRWLNAEARQDGVVNLDEIFKSQFAIGYALTYIYSDIDQDVRFLINSDDGNEIFLNNKKIFSINVFRGINGTEDIAKGSLKKGMNVLLVKISQATGGWEFRIKIDAKKNVRISESPHSTVNSPK